MPKSTRSVRWSTARTQAWAVLGCTRHTVLTTITRTNLNDSSRLASCGPSSARKRGQSRLAADLPVARLHPLAHVPSLSLQRRSDSAIQQCAGISRREPPAVDIFARYEVSDVPDAALSSGTRESGILTRRSDAHPQVSTVPIKHSRAHFPIGARARSHPRSTGQDLMIELSRHAFRGHDAGHQPSDDKSHSRFHNTEYTET